MKEFITPYTKANEILLRRNSNSYLGSFLIVEGTSDKKVYENLVEREKCEIENVQSKSNVIEILKILERNTCSGVLAIVDADFSRLEENQDYQSENLLLTDDHDLEMMLIKSPAFEKVLRERGSEEKIKRFAKDIRTALLESSKEIAYLRWHSIKYNLSLKFEELTFNKFIDKNTLSINILALITTVKNHSQKPSLKENEIEEQVNQLKKTTHDPYQICCGHDVICIFAIGLCKALGTNDTKDVQPEILERELRLAYESSFFSETQLYRLIKQWEQNNSSYQVLRQTI